MVSNTGTVVAAGVAALAALLGVFAGRGMDTRSEGMRWLRDVRLAKTESALRHLDTMRDCAVRLALPNAQRPVDKKRVDHHRLGEAQLFVMYECSALRLTGTKPLQAAADDLATFIAGPLRVWSLGALQAAEKGDPLDPEDMALVRLSELIGNFETAARDSLGARQLKLQR